MKPDFINPMVLAYLGDSIIELKVREYLIKESGLAKPKELYEEATKYVTSHAHAHFMFYALENQLLTEKEVAIYKHGRNTKNTKNETNDHRHSTGFEALIGHLYLEENSQRIDEIFSMFKYFIENEMNLKQI